MVLIIAKIQVSKPSLCRTMLIFKSIGMFDLVMDARVGASLWWPINQDHENYKQSKVGVVNTGCLEFTILIGLYNFCGKCNTCSNIPNAHTTGFHYVTLLSAARYCLPSTHKFQRHCSSNNTCIENSAHVLNATASVPGGNSWK